MTIPGRSRRLYAGSRPVTAAAIAIQYRQSARLRQAFYYEVERVVALFGVLLSLFSVRRLATVRGGNKTVIGVHYMPWFQTQPFSSSWGWHWTMNHFNPDLINATNGEQEIASWYYPLIGPYDSADPAVLEYHVLLMKLAGVDGVIVDWYGMDNYNDYAINNHADSGLVQLIRARRD